MYVTMPVDRHAYYSFINWYWFLIQLNCNFCIRLEELGWLVDFGVYGSSASSVYYVGDSDIHGIADTNMHCHHSSTTQQWYAVKTNWAIDPALFSMKTVPSTSTLIKLLPFSGYVCKSVFLVFSLGWQHQLLKLLFSCALTYMHTIFPSFTAINDWIYNQSQIAIQRVSFNNAS